MNIATGQARLFGSESKDAEKDNNVQRRGKRILGLPQAKREGNIVWHPNLIYGCKIITMPVTASQKNSNLN